MKKENFLPENSYLFYMHKIKIFMCTWITLVYFTWRLPASRSPRCWECSGASHHALQCWHFQAGGLRVWSLLWSAEGCLRFVVCVYGEERKAEKRRRYAWEEKEIQLCVFLVKSLLCGWTCDVRRNTFAVAEGPFLACVLMYLQCFVCLRVHKTLCIWK